MGKFLRGFRSKKPKRKPLPVTDKMKQELAENTLSNKVNSLAAWLESQSNLKGEERWNLFDAYVVLEFVRQQSIKPQLTKELVIQGDMTLENIFVKEEGEKDE